MFELRTIPKKKHCANAWHYLCTERTELNSTRVHVELVLVQASTSRILLSTDSYSPVDLGHSFNICIVPNETVALLGPACDH